MIIIGKDVEIVDRTSASAGGKDKTRPEWAVLSVGRKHKSAKDDSNSIYMMIQTDHNFKEGEKYKLYNNVEKIFGKSVSEGKCTIRFMDPPHDILISGAPVTQLRLFLGLVRAGINGKVNVSTLHCLNNVFGGKQKRRVINDHDSYSKTTKFSKSLEALEIVSCGLTSVDMRIFKLQHLTSLNLSNNNIRTLPDDWSSLNLKELNLSHNSLERLPVTLFPTYKSSSQLVSLDVSHNQLTMLPHYITRLYTLQTLDVSNNKLVKLPSDIGNLFYNLRRISASHNSLTSLPRSAYNFLCTFKVKHNPLLYQKDVDASVCHLTAEIAETGCLYYEDFATRLKNDKNDPNLLLECYRKCQLLHFFCSKDDRDRLLELLQYRQKHLKGIQQKIEELMGGKKDVHIRRLVTENKLEAVPSLVELAAYVINIYEVPYSPQTIGSSLCDYLGRVRTCDVEFCHGPVFQSFAVGLEFAREYHYKHIRATIMDDKLPIEYLICSCECLHRFLQPSDWYSY